MRAPGLPSRQRPTRIAGTRHGAGQGVKDSEEHLEDFREIWRILGEEFV
jgi:hypothetical protein